MAYLKLEWRNSCNIGNIAYAGADLAILSYKNKLFLDTEIGAPEYVPFEDGKENDNAEFVKEYESLVKNYRFKVVVPEDIADALQAMALHDDITITTTDGLYSSNIRNVRVNVNWEEDTNQCMATVEVFFQQDDQIIKTSCCD